jgi:hypothetical protein
MMPPVKQIGKRSRSLLVRRNPSLPGIHLHGVISPNTIASNTLPAFSIISTLLPRCVRFAGVTQATSVLSRMSGAAERVAAALKASTTWHASALFMLHGIKKHSPPQLETGLE